MLLKTRYVRSLIILERCICQYSCLEYIFYNGIRFHIFIKVKQDENFILPKLILIIILELKSK